MPSKLLTSRQGSFCQSMFIFVGLLTRLAGMVGVAMTVAGLAGKTQPGEQLDYFPSQQHDHSCKYMARLH